MSFRSIVLPLSMLLGLIFHPWCGKLYFTAPYLLFTMLFLNYSAVDVRKMAFSRMQLYLMLTQLALAGGLFALLTLLNVSEVISHGVLVGVLTPVAASVVVISCALGANRETVTTFTMINNLAIAIVAPILFSFVGTQTGMAFLPSFWQIFCRVFPQIVLPFVLAIILQHWMPKVSRAVSKASPASLYVWAVLLTIILGKTFHDVITAPDHHWNELLILIGIAVVLCGVQFGLGRAIGRRFGEEIAGGQLLGQKNTSFGIWLAVEYLYPLSAVFPAIYSVCQNFFNSWQMWRHDKAQEKHQD